MADFLQQGLPQASTPAVGQNGALTQFLFRFLEALWKRTGQGGNSDIVFSNGPIPVTAEKGFLLIPSCPGAPVGVPVENYGGLSAMVYDSTNKVLYIYPPGGPWTAV